MDEFFEFGAEWIESVAAWVEDFLEELGGLVNDEGFLALEACVGKSVFCEGSFEMIPADVVGNVLFACVLENVGDLFVVGVGSGGALRGVVDEVVQGFAVVKSDESSGPALGEDLVGELGGSSWQVYGVAFGGLLGELG